VISSRLSDSRAGVETKQPEITLQALRDTLQNLFSMYYRGRETIQGRHMKGWVR